MSCLKNSFDSLLNASSNISYICFAEVVIDTYLIYAGLTMNVICKANFFIFLDIMVRYKEQPEFSIN